MSYDMFSGFIEEEFVIVWTGFHPDLVCHVVMPSKEQYSKRQ